MKKILTLALTGVFAVTAFATESDPSNTVGFINQTLPTGYSAFSATPVGTDVGVAAGDYIGGQGQPGDVILEFTGAWVPYNQDATWTGLTFTYNHTYFYQNNSGSAQNLVIAGDVVADGTVVNMATFTAGAFNGYGHALPMDNDLDSDDLGLAAAGFADGDIIYNFTGAWVPFTMVGGVYGIDFLAGESYIVKINGASDVTWDYTVGAAPAAVTPQGRKVAKVRAASNLN